MSIETKLEDLDSSVEDWDDSVRSNTSALNSLVDAVKDLTEIVKGKPQTVNVSNAFSRADTINAALTRSTPTDEPVQENFCGFLEGDRVLYVSSVYKTGLPGVVKFHNTRAFRDGEVPVIREDSNVEDVFPARSTILASALEHYEAPAPEQWYNGDPEGSMYEWNERLLRAAADEGFYVGFIYQKPESLTPTAKRVTISRVTSTPSASDFGASVVTAVGYDPESHGPRNFRLDRIKSYVRPSE